MLCPKHLVSVNKKNLYAIIDSMRLNLGLKKIVTFIIVLMLGFCLGGFLNLFFNESTNLDSVVRKIKAALPSIKDTDPPLADPVSREFGILIPKIGVNAPIIADVDGSDKGDYLWKIKDGVGHFKALEIKDFTVDGAFPGEVGNIFIFGHSQIPGGDLSNYQGVFNQIPEMNEGDQIIIFYQNERFNYQVEEGKVVEKNDFEYLGPTEVETLTLMTCWPLGFENQRYIIRAKRI